MTDDRFDELMRDARTTYRTPPEPDLDAMWRSIERAHFGARGTGARMGARGFSVAPWMGIAATLLVGIGIGRASLGLDRAAPAAPAIAVAAPAVASEYTDTAMARPYEVETSQYLGQTAALLASLPSETRGGHADPEFAEQASDLLTRTRLLMDSPAANDASMRNLLEDLELVLVQIVRLQSGGSRTDLDLINRALEQRDVIPRLRTAAADISAN